MREWRGVRLSIKIVYSSVEGQRIDRLGQFDGLKIVGGNSGTATGLSFGTVGKESYMGIHFHLVFAYAFI